MIEPITLAVVAVFSVLTLYGMFVEPNWLRVRRRLILVPLLPSEMDGMTILHLSDPHFRGRATRADRFFKVAEGIPADLVVITGDFLDNKGGLGRCAAAIAGLAKDRRVAGVLGNHEHSHYSYTRLGGIENRVSMDTPAVAKAFRAAGLELLVNESTVVSYGGSCLTLVGLDDIYHQEAHWPKAMKDVRRDEPVIVLSHSPDVFGFVAGQGVSLVISGHTHGGQVRLPWYGAPITSTHYRLRRGSGMFRSGDTLMHVSPGLGTGLFPIRFLARPEITILELRTGGQQRVPAPDDE